jgi:hypothetical protein
MEDLNIRYEDHKGKWLFCIRDDKAFGIRKNKGYKILDVVLNNNDYFYLILTETGTKFPDGIAFKSNSKSFLSVKDSLSKLRQLKFERIVGGTEEQTFLSCKTPRIPKQKYFANDENCFDLDDSLITEQIEYVKNIIK